MKAKFVKYSLMVAAAATLVSCATHGKQGVVPEAEQYTRTPNSQSLVIGGIPKLTNSSGSQVAALPAAVIYKTNGDYDKNVTITLNATGQAPLSFPGPGDVGEQSVPLHLADGWLLDRRGGVGPNTVFLRYTYEQYHALPEVPTVKQLMDAIIPDARVVEAYRLPMTANVAQSDTAAVNTLIRDGLPGATALIETFTLPAR